MQLLQSAWVFFFKFSSELKIWFQKINKKCKGVYAVSVSGTLPSSVVSELKSLGIRYKPNMRDTTLKWAVSNILTIIFHLFIFRFHEISISYDDNKYFKW